jgi:hypothetical protein
MTIIIEHIKFNTVNGQNICDMSKVDSIRTMSGDTVVVQEPLVLLEQLPPYVVLRDVTKCYLAKIVLYDITVVYSTDMPVDYTKWVVANDYLYSIEANAFARVNLTTGEKRTVVIPSMAHTLNIISQVGQSTFVMAFSEEGSFLVVDANHSMICAVNASTDFNDKSIKISNDLLMFGDKVVCSI